MTVYKQFKETIARQNLITEGDSILIALSGGPDSIALLHLLDRIRKKMNLKLTALYINHQIRKKAALNEEKFCLKLCDQLEIELLIVREDIPLLAKKKKIGLEECGREFRYGVFSALVSEYRFHKVALGHHRDDLTETILFRIIRGTGPDGLIGFEAKRDFYIRPLIECSKENILAYLKSNKVKYCVDLSNEKNDFRRNYIRNNLLPLLRKEINQSVDSALLSLADTIREENRYLNKIIDKKVKKIISVSLGKKVKLKLSHFRKCLLWEQRRILRQALKLLQPTFPDKETINRLLEFIASGKKSISLPNKIQAHLLEEYLVLNTKTNLKYNYPLPYNKITDIHELNAKIKITCHNIDQIEILRQKRSNIKFFDKKKLAGAFFIRNIKPGDRFSPLGMKGTKKVGDFLTDRKVPNVFRDEIPVLCDQKGIIALLGWEIAERVKVDKNTKEVVKIEFLRSKRS